MTAFKATQQRGRWVAKLEDGFEELDVDPLDPRIAVVIRDEFCHLDPLDATMVHGPHPEKGFWWSLPRSARWRDLMVSGKPILMRHGPKPNGKGAGSKIGFFAVSDVRFNETDCRYRLLRQLGTWA